jgi:hypothetical protein
MDIGATVARRLESMFDRLPLHELSDSLIKPSVIRFINERTERGEFLGGERKNEGYSETTLPAWFFGRLRQTGGSWSIRSDVFNTTANPSSDELVWRAHAGGGATAYLIGGYKKFRELTGRPTNRVTLSFTGTMLRGLDGRTSETPEALEIEFGVYNERQRVSGYVNRQREFLGLNQSEYDKLAEWISNRIDQMI